MIKEIFHMHPPALLLVPHKSTNKVCGIAKGYDIPPHTRGLMNVWAMGQDPSIWEKPFEFYHQHFVQHHHHIVVEIINMDENNFELLPFGSGKRACPGCPLATLV
jgi:cytochrome P450